MSHKLDLKKIADDFFQDDHERYLNNWGISYVGAEIRLEKQLYAAVWTGKFDYRGEAPALAAIREKGTPYGPNGNWFAGVANDSDIPNERDKQLYAWIDAAQFSVQSLAEALNLLAVYLPVRS